MECTTTRSNDQVHRQESMAFGIIGRGCIRRFSSVSVPSTTTSSIRLSKWISENLQVSRKEAERCIRSGTVRIAGSLVPSPAALVSPDQLSGITVRGKKVNVLHKANSNTSLSSSSSPSSGDTATTATTTVWLIHKRRGELVTHADPRDRPVVRPPIPNAIFVGRLDMNTEGLLLCTNSGSYARELELPVHQYHRCYKVRVHGKLDDHKLRALERGLRVDDQTRYSAMRVVAETKKSSTKATNQWLEITCTQGQNRQIRNALAHLGLTVNRLIRTSFGDYELGSIPPGGMIKAPKRLTHRRKGPLRIQQQQQQQRSAAKATTAKPSTSAASPIRWVKA